MFRRPSRNNNLRRKIGKDFSKKFRISLSKNRNKNKKMKKIYNNISLMSSVNSKINFSNFISKQNLSNFITSTKTGLVNNKNLQKNKLYLRGKQINLPNRITSVKNSVKIINPLTKSRIVPVIKTSPTGNKLERHHISYQVKGGVNVKKRTKL
jgi:hypothetical protein